MSRLKNFDEVVEQLKTKLVDYLEDQGINTKEQFLCIHPDHNEDRPSAGIMRQSDFTKGHCLSCLTVFDIFDACSWLEGRPSQGPDFIKENVLYLCEKYGVEANMTEPTEEEKHRMEIFNAYKLATNYITTHTNEKALAEMEKRGWDPEECKIRSIGSTDSYDNYRSYMKGRFSVSFLENVDLLRPTLFSENNLIFTVCDEHGRPCGFGSKNLDWDPDNKDSKKYINSKNFGTDVRCQIYEKSKRLYNIHNTRRQDGPLYIMEGYADTETTIEAGLANVVCVGGTSFTEYHALELLKMGKIDIILCMDGDERGQASLSKILEKFTNYKEFAVRVVSLPENLDPDDYIRKYGLERFLNLRKWSAFEWKLNSYDDRIDTVLIRKEVVPIIASEISPIKREEMAKILSERIEISIDAIKEEITQILNETEAKRAKERDTVISSLVSDLKICPADWRLSVSKATDALESLSETYNEDYYSSATYLKDLEVQETQEEIYDGSSSIYELPEWREFSEALKGEWEQTLTVCGGISNSGKTAFLSNIALQLAKSPDEDIFPLFHTIDDTLKQFNTRIVCQYAQEKMSNISLNMIKKPNNFSNTTGINRAREYGYSRVKELVAQHRFLVRGGEMMKGAATLAFADSMIGYYQKLFPEKKIVYFLDNFHRLKDYASITDERIRFKLLSGAIKDIAKHRNIPIWATMEYTKLDPAVRPNNNNIAESVAMDYDANAILHLYNEIHGKRDGAELYFTRRDSEGRWFKAPRVEVIFGKNKISDFKGNLYFDFYAEQSRFVPVPTRVVQEDLARIKNERK